MASGQLRERLIEAIRFHCGVSASASVAGVVHRGLPLQIAAVLDPGLASRLVNEDASHGTRSVLKKCERFSYPAWR
jgi:hypothetical protein